MIKKFLIILTKNKLDRLLVFYFLLISPKQKHLKLKSNIDFLKLDRGKLGAINFNNMIPVTKDNIIEIDLNRNANNQTEEKYLISLSYNVDNILFKDKSIYFRNDLVRSNYFNNDLNIKEDN